MSPTQRSHDPITYVLVTTRDNATGETRERLFDTDYQTVRQAFKPGSIALGGSELVSLQQQRYLKETT
mgnify:FL=1